MLLLSRSRLLIRKINVKMSDGVDQKSFAENGRKSVLNKDKNQSDDVKVGDVRRKYRDDLFTENDLAWKEPLSQFRVWFEEASQNSAIEEANAMCLATATKDGIPSARFVLLKSFNHDGFKFFSNYESRKGRELQENPRASLTFYWEPLKRQVRVEGKVEKVADVESNEYYASRPRDSQIGAWSSRQSTVIAGRDELMTNVKEFTEKFKDVESIPRPNYWGGYIVLPEKVEFWQGHSDRLHDRICFRRMNPEEKPDGVNVFKGENGWVYERLSP